MPRIDTMRNRPEGGHTNERQDQALDCAEVEHVVNGTNVVERVRLLA
jgi:hypothetical protein